MFSQTLPSPAKTPSRKQRRLAKKRARKGRTSIHVSSEVEQGLKRARQLEKSDAPEVAAKHYIQLTKAHHNVAAVHYFSGLFFEGHEMNEPAYAGLKRAVVLEQSNAQYWSAFGVHLFRTGHFHASVIAYQNASKLRPDDPELLSNLAWAHYKNNDIDNALDCIDAALKIRPGHAKNWYQKGAYLGSIGEFRKSHEAYFKALELDPDQTSIYYELLRSGAKIENADEVLLILKNKLARKNATNPVSPHDLFAIAKIQDQQKNYDSSFGYYLKANKSASELINYDLERDLQGLRDYQQAYTREIFAELSAAGSDSSRPVFIVGMPRSGTTLVEQIISSHSQATSAGELNKMGLITRTLDVASAKNCRYPLNISQTNPAVLNQLGEEYSDYLHKMAPGDWRRIVDKMPINFVFVGLIKLLFPKAAILHCKRDAMDICISNFTTYFSGSYALGFSNDLETLGRFYRGYERMMAHWHQVLPGQIYDVQYEDVIENPETVSRNIIEHIGLDWEENCLRFHQNRSSVRTASKWQVRQPIYNSSVGRWRRYEKFLEPLQKALLGDEAAN